MGLIDRLAQPAPKPAVRNRVDIWLETLTEAEQEAVKATAASRAWSHVELLEALVAEGMPEISDNAFGKWRRKMGWKP